ncbi:MAG: extracellular solute-binding protein, partial [Micromonosporaceae bacterium]
MRRKIAIAAALAATLIGAAACSQAKDNNSGVSGEGKTIKVWLMVDAQSSWKNVVDDANQRFTAKTKAQVKVEYQQWSNLLTTVDAALASSEPPDLLELGNTQMPKYVFDGVFADLDKSKFENSSTWLTGLSGPCTLDGKTYCVPYYAGARVLIYRTDLFTNSGLKPPTTYADLLAAADKLKTDNAADPNFASFYMPGAYWYAAMSWVYGNGGTIATKGG